MASILNTLPVLPELTAAGLTVRLVAAVFVVSFTSIAWQLPGLVGSRGILPVARLLRHVSIQHEACSKPRQWLLVPTLL